MPKVDRHGGITGIKVKVPTLGRVVYQDLWEGISLTYESMKDGITEAIYCVAPGASVSSIRLRYNVPVEEQRDGSLKFKFSGGYLTESPPVAWQEIEGRHIPVSVSFRLSDGEVGFKVGNYNPSHTLTIDPTYAWHTFYGSNNALDSATDEGYSIAVDDSGNVYVTGISVVFWNGPSGQPPLNLYSGYGGIFVLKLDSSGAYQWHTFYGSNNAEDFGYGVAVDGSGDVYVTGSSHGSWNGPSGQTPLNPYSVSAVEIFVLKLNSSGAYQWHTFYGHGYSAGYGIRVDGSGNVYVTGYFGGSWNGPSGQTPLNPCSASWDIFVLKLNSSGAYQWHTFHGSTGEDYGQAIAVDGNGNVYVTGYSTASWNGPSGQTPLNPYSPYSGSADVFVLKLNSSGAYQWHTFYSSDYVDYIYGYGIAVDGSGNVYVTGTSFVSWNGPSGQPPLNPYTLNPYSGSADIFVLKLNSSGAYQWHTFYGSANDDAVDGIAVDGSGDLYVTGYSTASWNGPSGQPPLNPYSGSADIFVLKLNSSGAYQWHTFYGSTGEDYGQAIAVNGSGNVYVTGAAYGSWNGSSGQTPLNPYSASWDIFVLKLTQSLLYADFTGDGLYQWGNGAGALLLTRSLPASMVASGSLLYADFAGDGFYKYDGSVWSRLTASHPANMLASGSLLYADFTGDGFYKYDGGGWTLLTRDHPASIVASGSLLFADFTGYGLYSWNGTAWTRLTNAHPATMLASGSLLFADFALYGLYSWNGTAWTQLTNAHPASMVSSGSTLYADFAAYGLYSWNGTAWTQLTNAHPASMVASGSTLYADFAAYGLYSWSGTAWTQLTNAHTAGMVASGSTLYADFAAYGLYQWDGGTWTQLTTSHPASMLKGF